MKKRCSKRDAGKERFWREAIWQQAESGQSVRAFCRERKLTESSFYFWRQELRKRERAKSPARADRPDSDVEEKVDTVSSELFVPMVAEALGKTVAATADETIGATASETPATSVEMTLPSGSVLRWPGCDLNELAEAIAALEARLC